ncbi:MAG TPA: DUF2188 domain-containing protein [Thermoanaerobaculia bacterium]|jgi:hypothetical protein|nr:DUF2188 domain-containing protein [Thermoanaerobaculia bacterium]
MTKTLHVEPHADGWAIRREGSKRAASIYKSKQDAIDEANKLSFDVVIHGKTGQPFRRSPVPPSIDPKKLRQAVREVRAASLKLRVRASTRNQASARGK